MNIEYVGIKNVSGAPEKLVFDGDPHYFEKDEVKLFTRDGANHALKCLKAGKKPFAEIPLRDALKLVKEPENPSIAGAKRDAQVQGKLEEKIAAQVIAKLKAEGWTPPVKAAPQADGKKLPVRD